MPRENKKRGRREADRGKKRKRLDANDVPIGNSKRRRLSQEPTEHSTPLRNVSGDKDDYVGQDYIALNIHTTETNERYSENLDSYHDDEDTIATNPHLQTPIDQRNIFHGLLTSEESDYFSAVNAKLDANDFSSPEDRDLFVEAVHRELKGKELKVACSQSASRVLERVVGVSTVKQVRELLGRLLGNLGGLVCHRFGSHVVECLLRKGAEILGLGEVVVGEGEGRSTEDMFVEVATELTPDVGYLMTEKFATHVVRTLMLILSGEPLDSEFSRNLLGRKRKDTPPQSGSVTQDHHVPLSFHTALTEMIEAALTGLETSYLRSLATSATGNPVLQILLRFELSVSGKEKFKDERSVLRRLFPDESFEHDADSAKFIQGLVYDPKGSRLIEVLIHNMPGKRFKKFYKNILQPQLSNLSKNEIASHVASQVLERLGKDDLEDAIDRIAPELPQQISRNQLTVLRTLIERTGVRQADPTQILEVLHTAYGEDETLRLPRMLHLDPAPESTKTKPDKRHKDIATTSTLNVVSPHGSTLAQRILRAPPPLSNFLHTSILSLDASLLVALSKDRNGTHIIQTALTSPYSPSPFLRQLSHGLQPHVLTLAGDPIGSHVLDALWTATSHATGLHFIKEGIDSNLAGAEGTLRACVPGRVVWRNWNLDLYRRRPREWQVLARQSDDADGPSHANGSVGRVGCVRQENAALAGKEEGDDKENHAASTNAGEKANEKTPIERARERHFARRQLAKNRRAVAATR